MNSCLLNCLFILPHLSLNIEKEWKEALKPYCKNTKSSGRVPQERRGVREIYTLTINVVEVKHLAEKVSSGSSIYCQINLNDVAVAKTQTKDVNSLVWDEEFILEWAASSTFYLSCINYSVLFLFNIYELFIKCSNYLYIDFINCISFTHTYTLYPICNFSDVPPNVESCTWILCSKSKKGTSKDQDLCK